MTNPVQRFVRDVAERAVKTAAQSALLGLITQNAGHLDALAVRWQPVAGLALGGFVLSILTSLGSQPFGDSSSASLLSGTHTSAPVAETSASGTSGVSDTSDL
jgi:hypothetical protein